MKFSPLVDRIAGEAADAWDLHFYAAEKAQDDPDIILLSVGDPDMNTPKPIIESVIDSLWRGRTHYTGISGIRPMREAIAAFYQSEFCPHLANRVTAENVAVVPGAQCGLFAAAMCVLSQGDEVIIPEPMYVTYPGVIGSTGADIVMVPLSAEKGFQLDAELIAQAITPHTRAIVINSPHNPTGAVIETETLERIAELCLAHDIWLISDEVYGHICFDQPYTSAVTLESIADRTIVLSSLSKSHAMSGWRMGWVVMPPSLTPHVDNILSAMLYGSPMFTQDAAATALQMPEIGRQMCDVYRQRRELVLGYFEALPQLRLHRPAGGMFMMLDVRPTGLTAADFASRLFEEEKVSLLAADAFGPSAIGHLRMSLTVPEEKLKVACARIATFVTRLSSPNHAK